MRRSARAPRGVSLIEIVVYITIASMILAAVGIYAVGVSRDSQRSIAFTDVKTAHNALEMYRGTTGRYPDPDQGFAQLIKRRTLKKPPKDPWGNELQWELDANTGEPVVISLGSDGKPGGEEDAADIRSTDEEPQ